MPSLSSLLLSSFVSCLLVQEILTLWHVLWVERSRLAPEEVVEDGIARSDALLGIKPQHSLHNFNGARMQTTQLFAQLAILPLAWFVRAPPRKF